MKKIAHTINRRFAKAVIRATAEGTPQLDIALKALNSIAKNTCCDSCREAALVARSALNKLATPASTGEANEHIVSDASEDEQKQNCCGDRYSCNYRYRCSCGLLACANDIEQHIFKLHQAPAPTSVPQAEPPKCGEQFNPHCSYVCILDKHGPEIQHHFAAQAEPKGETK